MKQIENFHNDIQFKASSNRNIRFLFEHILEG